MPMVVTAASSLRVCQPRNAGIVLQKYFRYGNRVTFVTCQATQATRQRRRQFSGDPVRAQDSYFRQRVHADIVEEVSSRMGCRGATS
jgi:hypothetical protein